LCLSKVTIFHFEIKTLALMEAASFFCFVKSASTALGLTNKKDAADSRNSFKNLF